MKLCIVVLFLFSMMCINAQAQKRDAGLQEIIGAENSFADYAAAKGTKDAFLAFADDSGLVFSSKPENAKESWQKRSANSALLAWRPSWADVSEAGDVGYTTGTWSYSRSKSDAAVAWGEYFTIWKKQPDGSWKFLLDLGIGHDKAEVVANNWKSPSSASTDKKKSAASSDAEVWNKLENTFAESVNKNGLKKTYEKLASEQIRLLRDGRLPFQSKPVALGAINNAELKSKVLGGGASGDFAYVYGEYELKISDSKVPDSKLEKGFYVRVWKHEADGWKIGIDLAHPIPEK